MTTSGGVSQAFAVVSTPIKPQTISTAPLLALVGDDGPRWVEMLRTGVHKSRFVGGTSASGHDAAEFTRSDLESAARGFAALKGEGYLIDGAAPVGYDHAEFSSALRMVTGQPADEGEAFSAAAWFSDLRVEPNEAGGFSLMGLHHYTDAGRARVRAGAFRGYSIDIAPPGAMQRRDGTAIDEWVPFGGTLTNSPFVRSMAPIAATENTTKEIQMDITLLRDALSLTEDATEAQALAALHALTEKAARADALEANLDRVTAERDAKVADLAALSERQRSLTIRQAVHDGRIGLSQGDDFWDTLTALGEERAHRIFPSGAIATQPAAQQTTQPADKGAESTTADEKFEAVRLASLADGKNESEAYHIADLATRTDRARFYAGEA